MVLKRIASPYIDDTGGLFISIGGDDPAYPDRFRSGCDRTGVRCHSITTREAREMEPLLTEEITTAFEVEDASLDPFSLTYANCSCLQGKRALHRPSTMQRSSTWR